MVCEASTVFAKCISILLDSVAVANVPSILATVWQPDDDEFSKLPFSTCRNWLGRSSLSLQIRRVAVCGTIDQTVVYRAQRGFAAVPAFIAHTTHGFTDGTGLR